MEATPSRVRPHEKQGGQPIPVELAFLTKEQRKLWDRHFPHLSTWTHGTRCQATCLELLNFDYICILDDEPPRWPPHTRAVLGEYGRMVRDYMSNVKTARKAGGV